MCTTSAPTSKNYFEKVEPKKTVIILVKLADYLTIAPKFFS